MMFGLTYMDAAHRKFGIAFFAIGGIGVAAFIRSLYAFSDASAMLVMFCAILLAALCAFTPVFPVTKSHKAMVLERRAERLMAQLEASKSRSDIEEQIAAFTARMEKNPERYAWLRGPFENFDAMPLEDVKNCALIVTELAGKQREARS